MLAVALLDGEVMPEQYNQERIERDDVQQLLRRVEVEPRRDYSERFPQEMPCSVTIHLKDGSIHRTEKDDYEGFVSRPMNWDGALQKFNRLTGKMGLADEMKERTAELVNDLENRQVSGLTKLLASIDLSD